LPPKSSAIFAHDFAQALPPFAGFEQQAATGFAKDNQRRS
jgi:hypothetical protein